MSADFGVFKYRNDVGDIRWQPHIGHRALAWRGGGGDEWKEWVLLNEADVAPRLYKSKGKAAQVAVKEFNRRARANWRKVDE